MASNSVTRQELKYLISNQEYHYLRCLLKSMMLPDKHGNAQGEYYIRSLYFDDAGNSDYFTKEAGLNERRKIRLRLYDLDSENVKLEIKNKVNQYLIKETAVISKADAIKLSQGDIDVLTTYDQDTSNKLYKLFKTASYKPVMLIDYEREAYVLEGLDIRINFDKNIRALAHTDLTEDMAFYTPLIDYGFMVLEVKFSHVLPDFIRDILSSSKLVKTTYSKYCLSREMVW